MARRRLAPAAPLAQTDVPHAEHFPALESKGFSPPSPTAPIARVAAEAAATAALQEMGESLRRARETGRLVLDLPLGQIAPDHLARDRLPVEDAEMASLRDSLRAHGQRTPIEVTPLGVAADGAALPYGLISGWRRLMALKALHAETGEPRFATIQALVRRPETAAAAYVSMVEENEIRLGLSQYERARVAALSTRRGVFETEKAALLALFATASRAKRSRIRAFLDIFHALDGVLRFPAHLPERLGLQLVEMVRAGQAGRIAAAIDRDDPQSPEAERATLGRLTRPQPAQASEVLTSGVQTSGAAEEIVPGMMLATALKGRILTLRLEGRGVTAELRTAVETAVEAAVRTALQHPAPAS